MSAADLMRTASAVAVLVAADAMATTAVPFVRPAIIVVLAMHCATMLRAASVRSADESAAVMLAQLTGALAAGLAVAAVAPRSPSAFPNVIAECLTAFVLTVVVLAAPGRARLAAALVALVAIAAALPGPAPFGHPVLLLGTAASTSFAGRGMTPVGPHLLAQLIGAALAVSTIALVRHARPRRT